jgi:soluble lytic murein transglycosylase-like protein
MKTNNHPEIIFLLSIIIFMFFYSKLIVVPISSKYEIKVPKKISYFSILAKDSGLERIVKDASLKYNIDIYLIYAIIKVESDFNQFAVSYKGAKGLMQIMPKTAQEVGIINIFDIKENVFGGTKYISILMKRFNNDLDLVLAAYNSGPTRVSKLKKIPKIYETEQYVIRVLYYYNLYRIKKEIIR